MKETKKTHARNSEERMKNISNSECHQRGERLSRQERYHRQLRWRRPHVARLSSFETENPRNVDLLLGIVLMYFTTETLIFKVPQT